MCDLAGFASVPLLGSGDQDIGGKESNDWSQTWFSLTGRGTWEN